MILLLSLFLLLLPITIIITIILSTTTEERETPDPAEGTIRDWLGRGEGGRGKSGWICSAEKSEAGEIAKIFPPLNTPLRKSLRNPQTGELQRPDSMLGILAEECRKYEL